MRQMSFDNFKSYVSKIPVDVEIWFAGMCEPWLNNDCTNMLLHAHERGHKIRVFTTLVGMNGSDVALLESVPFGFFQVHLPSSRESERIPVHGDYLDLLNKICTSKIINLSFHCHGGTVHSDVNSLLRRKGKKVDLRSLYRRSGNIKISKRHELSRKRGVIGCLRSSLCNVLLPNGDVLLCSNDYGMKHILGNLRLCTYDALFQSHEFLKIKRGHRNESEDILCRYCDNFGYNVNAVARLLNFGYQLDRYLYYLKDIQSFEDMNHFIQKGIEMVKKKCGRL